jgi:hypothetical protein
MSFKNQSQNEQTMKKLILLLSVFALTFTSCSNDDDNPPPVNTSIVGTWKFFKSFENGVEETLELCDPEQTLMFSENGTLNITPYEEINGVCEATGNINGTWSHEEAIYSLTFLGMTESQEIIVEGSTFYIETTEGSGTTQITYKEIYKRQ